MKKRAGLVIAIADGQRAAAVRSNAWTRDERLLLSSWEKFGDYWQEADGHGDGCSYEEACEDGSVRHYRLKDGVRPWSGQSMLDAMGCERIGDPGEPGEWEFAAVNCSTGEVS